MEKQQSEKEEETADPDLARRREKLTGVFTEILLTEERARKEWQRRQQQRDDSRESSKEITHVMHTYHTSLISF